MHLKHGAQTTAQLTKMATKIKQYVKYMGLKSEINRHTLNLYYMRAKQKNNNKYNKK